MKKNLVRKYGIRFENETIFSGKDILALLLIVFGIFGHPILIMLGLFLISLDHIKIVEETKWKN